ncbi:multisubunit Na+/H+ antiporter MnhE subunit [Salirhabdus euzebyi]|uniref:Multisubunit Na+/H+ antiporter MnhE subunit n=1 Tax=Salirhabdus euzebyi TaxID=394506 RepID=A0A841Q7V7_9BACI|nr:DUF3267 domain-containing protein [Salirhabdus euzebyi]MBB6454669.1 multisubunit Na+/H+ antiporter MnhE subunit [Salirhabdus euzebyi]
MNNCWKTVNITRELGQGRIYIMSCLIGLFAFILLFLPYSILHQHTPIKDLGFGALLIILVLLPTLHKMTHVLPLVLLNKRMRVRWQLEMGFIPTISYQTKTQLSKGNSIFMWLSPTIFLTIPGLVVGFVTPTYYPYIIVFTAMNIGMSFKDFLYIKQFIYAPKKCIIENAKDGYDILVQR